MDNEHDDDLEPEVDDGAEIETETYPDDDDLEGEGGGDGTQPSGHDDPPAGQIDKEEDEGAGER
jgi:hypothetical protein